MINVELTESEEASKEAGGAVGMKNWNVDAEFRIIVIGSNCLCESI